MKGSSIKTWRQLGRGQTPAYVRKVRRCSQFTERGSWDLNVRVCKHYPCESSWQLLGPEQLGMILGPLYILAPPHHFYGTAPKIFAAGNWGACGVRFLYLVSGKMLLVGGEIGAD